MAIIKNGMRNEGSDKSVANHEAHISKTDVVADSPLSFIHETYRPEYNENM